jgi:hypothetical protein
MELWFGADQRGDRRLVIEVPVPFESASRRDRSRSGARNSLARGGVQPAGRSPVGSRTAWRSRPGPALQRSSRPDRPAAPGGLASHAPHVPHENCASKTVEHGCRLAVRANWASEAADEPAILPILLIVLTRIVYQKVKSMGAGWQFGGAGQEKRPMGLPCSTCSTCSTRKLSVKNCGAWGPAGSLSGLGKRQCSWAYHTPHTPHSPHENRVSKSEKYGRRRHLRGNRAAWPRLPPETRVVGCMQPAIGLDRRPTNRPPRPVVGPAGPATGREYWITVNE